MVMLGAKDTRLGAGDGLAGGLGDTRLKTPRYRTMQAHIGNEAGGKRRADVGAAPLSDCLD